ncbi:hypothetical protein [Streptomyces sp. MBT53]|uniref:hypothetical protein n=1 Tax=Streptomyces sp. MBT53 TaxID=1488384 RepID=UPI0019142181|nr:hypothetical protein [Streptomyces sp. MBT53]MBK6014647.1 hypothetical protein [Streptomyces sp. MBT53]
MERRRLLAVLATLAVATGCSTHDDKAEPSHSASSESSDGARQAVEAYVDALNSRSATGLIKVGGVEDESWSRQEAAQILEDRGGQEWKIKDVQIDHDMGPDTGSARLLADGKAGKSLSDTFTVTREKGVWHLAVFTHQPNGKDKESSSTDKPAS